ncbi:ParB/RepB/Spo0J family partition protein [Stenotrophomonas sp. STK17_22]|uniref:ParB/RepB/Spo0J family partition protein n=1 Tax=Stenotrophomonas sp. STK17_22 TaxID=3455201 RepID=UPI003F815F23
MALDFDELNLDVLGAPPVADGKPFRVKLEDIRPDPDQPRTEKSEEDIADLAENISERGVKLPISIRSDAENPGKWIINDGEMRYLASQKAGKSDIPAVVDEDFDDFDQVNANEKRYRLSPMDLALFIKSKIDQGVKKNVIAKRLGKSSSVIAEYLALVDCPEFILELYRTRRLTSIRTIYELRQLHDKFPEQVDEYLVDVEGEVERKDVAALAARLKNPGTSPSAGSTQGGPVVEGDVAAPVESPVAVQPDSVTPLPSPAEGPVGGTTGGDGEQTPPEPIKVVAHNPAHQQALNPKPSPTPDPTRLKKPVMLVEFDGRAAMVLLWNRPSNPGLLRLKFDDNAEELEVDAGRCKINCLIEAS